MFTLQGLMMKTDYMMEEIRRRAVDDTLARFQTADRHYYETCEGGAEVTRLIHELEDLGVDPEWLVEEDLRIRDTVFEM